MAKGTVFTQNSDVVKAKGWIPYWQIASELSIHENTLRNWMRVEMSLERKERVLKAIKEIKKRDEYQVQ